MSNFSLLERYGRELPEIGSQAESDLYDRPKICATQLRTLLEDIARQIVEEKGLDGRRDKSDKSLKANFDENLTAVKLAHIAPKGVIDDFYFVKRKGNDGAHPGGRVSVEDAEKALRGAHRAAVWFVRDYKGRKDDIPEFVLPEENAATTKSPRNSGPTGRNGTGEFLDSPIKRWGVVVASALGLMWLWELYKDPEHRWDLALGKVARTVIIVSVLVLLLLPLLALAHGATLWSIYSYFVSSLSNKLGWNQYLIQSLVLIFLLPFLFALKMFLSPLNYKKQRQGAVLLIAMAVGYNLMFYGATRNTAFRPDNGVGIKYYARTDQGIVTFDRPGYDPATGQLLLPVTPEIEREIVFQTTGPLAKVDPARADWFNSHDGKAMLWYYRFPNGELTFYNKPGMDPQTGDILLPVTKELFLSWRSEQEAEASNAGAKGGSGGTKSGPQIDAFRSVLSAGAGAGAPGILLLRMPGTDRGGTDALSHHLEGLNSSAFHDDAMQRQGFASRLYEGDGALIREAVSITRLSSLVVAEVTAKCEKRSSLDPDLLSCDLTANARKFDGQGNHAGSVLARGTGAGFNQADALEQAAQRASVELIALAKR